MENFYCLIPESDLSDAMINASVSYSKNEMPLAKVKSKFLWLFPIEKKFYILEFIWEDQKSQILGDFQWLTLPQIRQFLDDNPQIE